MKHAFHAALVVALLTAPVTAQVGNAPAEDEGFSQMREGAELFFRGIMDEMEPAMEDFRAFAEMAGPHLRALLSEMGPALMQVLDQIDDIAHYEAPEVLENGDIIIRRKREAPEFAPVPDAPEIET